MSVADVIKPKRKRAAANPPKRTAKQRTASQSDRPAKARPRTDVRVDMTRREAFLLLPPAEREQRIQSFIDAFAPAFAGYSSVDFRADQTREAERES